MKNKMRGKYEDILAKEHAAYVLITCDKATPDGRMHINMTYSGGDPVLASYLMQGAQNVVDQEIEADFEEADLRIVK